MRVLSIFMDPKNISSPLQRTANHKCTGAPDTFCFVCGDHKVAKKLTKLTNAIRSLYEACFSMTVPNAEAWTPHTICNACAAMLKRWKTRGKNQLKFTSPTIWREPSSSADCYFCITDVSGIKQLKPELIVYPEVSTVTRAILATERNSNSHTTKDLVTDMVELNVEGNSEKDTTSHDAIEEEIDGDENNAEDDSTEEFVPYNQTSTKEVKQYSQEELNDLIRNLGLSKEAAELLASDLKSRNMLTQTTKVTFYRNRDKEYRSFFTQDSNLVYCNDIKGLINKLKPAAYKVDEWRLFIDSSTRSLKGVLLHNTNKFAPIPVAHSTVLKEEYTNIEMVLRKLNYEEHRWFICGDLKILSMILGQQSGFTKHPCFLCEWDSRDRQNHYVRKEWPQRTSLQPGSKNVIRQPLVEPCKILLPPLHIKLGLMKQFVKALDKEGHCFEYIQRAFPKLSDAKVQQGVFDGPQIRTLLKDKTFATTMTDTEKAAWLGFKNVVENFLGNTKGEQYQEIVTNMIESFRELGCLMNLKLHFLDSHLDSFPENLGDFSEEQGERFHQDMQEMERRYQGRWDINMMADFCWTLKRDMTPNKNKRQRRPLRRSFEDKKVRKRAKT